MRDTVCSKSQDPIFTTDLSWIEKFKYRLAILHVFKVLWSGTSLVNWPHKIWEQLFVVYVTAINEILNHKQQTKRHIILSTCLALENQSKIPIIRCKVLLRNLNHVLSMNVFRFINKVQRQETKHVRELCKMLTHKKETKPKQWL